MSYIFYLKSGGGPLTSFLKEKKSHMLYAIRNAEHFSGPIKDYKWKIKKNVLYLKSIFYKSELDRPLISHFFDPGILVAMSLYPIVTNPLTNM